jgi:protein O-GlcNAc transferase
MGRRPSAHRDPAAEALQEGLQRQRAGDLDQALACYARVPERHGSRADALHLSGIIQSQRGDPAKGVALIGQALALSPGVPLYLVNLANALEALGRVTDAEDALRRALTLDPKFVPALFNLGNLLSKQQRDDEAIAALDRTVTVEPTHTKAWLALVDALTRKRERRLAGQVAARAKQLAPSDREVSDVFIGAMLGDDRYLDALAEFDRRLATGPRSFELLQGRAFCLDKTAQLSEAEATYREVIALRPGDFNLIFSLTETLTLMGKIDAAIETIDDAIAAGFGEKYLHSNRLFKANYHDRLSPAEMLALHRGWESLIKLERPPCVHSAPQRKERLRIGYVSEDFKRHPVASFIERVLAAHDRSRVEVFAYFVHPQPDATTERIRGHVDCFRELHGNTAAETAEIIRRDNIDIVIDLAGHTSVRVLEALLYKPAPVQIDWLGYPNTTGLSTMDYRISDGIADPPGAGDAWNSEKVLRLPDCFHCFGAEIPVAFAPTPAFERQGGVTFGSFNLLPKMSQQCVETWARIVRAVPGSRLLLKNRALHDDGVRRFWLDRFAAAGLASDRIALVGDQAGWDEHMLRYREVDIALDPFPYNGTTTTCEALWMGVPVVTRLGDRHGARVGGSLLTAIGHRDLIADSVEGYVDLAVGLANDPARMRALHARLHDDMAKSPLCDTPRFTANLENAYRDAWSALCAEHH